MSAGPQAELGRTRVQRAAGAVAGVAILGFLIWAIASEWGEVSDFDWSLDPAPLLGGIAVLLAFYAVSGLGYGLIVERLDHGRPAARWTLVSIWARSLLGRYVPGTVLMITGRVVLGRRAGIAGRISVAASIYEQILQLTTAAVASLFYLALYDDPGGASWVLLAAATASGLVLVHPRVLRVWSSWLLRKAGREPLEVFLSERQLIVLFAYYAVASAMVGLGVWLLVRAAAGPEAGDAAYVGLAFLLSFVLGMVAFIVPSGLGVRDAAFAIALGKNLPSAVAAAISAAVRLVLTAVELVFIGLVVAAERGRSRSVERAGGAER